MTQLARYLGQILALTLLCVAILFQTARGETEAQARIAILIGNSGYGSGLSLPNPVNDVRALGNVLAELGFKVHALEDGNLQQMRDHLDYALEDVPDHAMLLFFYAGHAVQKNNVNWLLPIDFVPTKGVRVEETALGSDEILKNLETVPDATRIVILDACRNYPLGDADEVVGNGLAGLITQGNSLIAYATLAGDVARDGNGPNSPYTGALVSALNTPGLELYDLFRTVRYKVRSATDGLQLPWVSGSLPPGIVLNASIEESPAELAQLDGLDPIQAVHWRAIARSNDPGDFEAFVTAYADSPARNIALQREQELLAEQVEPTPPVQIDVVSPEGAPFTITACDTWVSDPLDPKRIAPGVPWGLVNTRNAIRDCSIALSQDPDNPRLSFLLARALDIAENFDDALRFYERAAAAGYGAASRNLGYMYRNARGVAPDDSLAASFYFQASLDGVVDARKALAKLYEEGWGVPQSYPEMLRWLNLSAEENYPNSLDHLGNLYRTGTYVPQDDAKALELYQRGASVGYGNAIANLARVYRDGLGVGEDRARAMTLYQSAVDRGNAFAPYHLGRMLLDPKGDELADPVRARELLELSAERGYSWALWQLARSWKDGDFGEVDLDTAAFYLWIGAEAGNSMRNTDGEKLVADATELLQEIEPQLSQARRDAVEQRTQQWLKQNSLLDFSLLFPY
ncbi:caspase family protein [Paracoccus zhejiangensis]|uniref:caspase family protein n=1 Tax=Paracoccus zhejiangensis TaxID=1077935 RepID=UPI0018E470A8|nr:caspase family protein [Paracoccus zhejiangensis]